MGVADESAKTAVASGQKSRRALRQIESYLMRVSHMDAVLAPTTLTFPQKVLQVLDGHLPDLLVWCVGPDKCKHIVGEYVGIGVRSASVRKGYKTRRER